MELGCALMENLIQLFDEELFQNQNLQCPIVFHAITRFRSLSSREMVESPRERLTTISKESSRELEERREGGRSATLAQSQGVGVNSNGMEAWTSKGAPSSSFYSFSTPLFH